MKSSPLCSLLTFAALLLAPGLAKAEFCPFCSAVDKTFTDEIGSVDVAVIAKLLKSNKDAVPDEEKTDDELALQEIEKSDFEIVEIVKGKEFLKAGMKFQAIFFGDSQLGDKFFVTGVDPPDISWSTPLAVNAESISYIKKLPSLPEEGGERLIYFQDYLEHTNELLARDAYDEFAKAPYDAVIELKPRMDHDQLLKWIKTIEIPASRKRLYFTMLGICGEEKDAALLEELMKSEDRLQKAGLDAMVACYLNLVGEKGLSTINELFLANQKSDYSDTYAAISALRFHGMETKVVPKQKLIESLRLILKRAKYSDLVIPDLARWEDWESMDQLVDLFKNSSGDNSWVRVPVINYLRACPLPTAKEHLVELEKLDPKAFKRAITFFPLLDDEDEEGDEEDEEGDEDVTTGEESAVENTGESPQPKADKIESQKRDRTEKANPQANTAEPAAQVIPTSVNHQNPQFVSNEVPTQVDANTTVALRPPTADKSRQRRAAVAGPLEESSDPTGVVAEVTVQQTMLIGLISVFFCGLLYGLMWLVISGRIDRIGF